MITTASEATRWSEGLVGPAYDIVVAESERMRVAAGPGTGKTFAMMRRVARLLTEGIDPARILMVTFTRTAARDLVESIEEMGIPGSRDITVGTLHSFAFSTLARNEVLTMTGRVPRPMLQFEERVMYEDLKQPERGVRECERLIGAFEAGWARLQSDDPGWPHNPEEQHFQRDMLNWLIFHQAMLLAEIIIETRNYLRNNPGAPEREAFDHVIVDEYQDLNRADQEAIDLLAEAGTLAIVGDEDQAIYSLMRYAQPESMQDFAVRHSQTTSLALEICRRCPTKIISMANSLIANNSNREVHELLPEENRGAGLVDIIQWQSMEKEAAGIAELVDGHIQEREIDLHNVLVLVPRRTLGYLIRDALIARDIAAHSFFYEEALDTQLAKERFTLLSLLVDPTDRVSLRVWLGSKSSTHLSGSYRRLREYCEETASDPFEELARAASGKPRIKRITNLTARYQALLMELDNLDGLAGHDLIDALFPKTEDDLASIRRVALDALEVADRELGPKELLDEVRARVVYPEPPPSADYVRVMSLHKSKGLSARLVVVAGCVQGWIPTLSENLKGAEARRQLEEQRRLFYVAITRTREVLILSSFRTVPSQIAFRQRVRFSRNRGGRVDTIASQFFNELGPEAPIPRRA